MSGSNDSSIKVWNSYDATLIRTIAIGIPVTSIKYINSNYAATGLSNGSILIWNLNDGTLSKSLDHQTNMPINDMILAYDQTVLASASNMTINLWDLRLFVIKKTITAPNEITCLETHLSDPFIAYGLRNTIFSLANAK